MIKYPTTRIVFDRKKTATQSKTGLVQVEIMFERKRKYISSGVKVFKGQWNERGGVCNRIDMLALNSRINAVKEKVDGYIRSLIEKNVAFDWKGFGRYISFSDKDTISFVEWLEERINSRTDIRETTRRVHRKLIYAMHDFRKISFFGDLTKANVMAFDDYLHARGQRQTTVYSYHKMLKTYIYDAQCAEIC
ncbi:phage integrase SAM-like domain-containing protein [Xylanibacter muris]|uniref:Core-binding (CB) domain-containing protein n=1 Tax=Xylanibacter muris TaxID=2736290 RepID=A0ABX2AM78_9BACT|nr:phage integrase SAM-like domain-containing protein [Xylanibacter muris]NPD92331.1 hypothetical protein [Xylanibacter muris]